MLVAPTIDAPQRLGFLLVPQFSMLAFVSAIEPLRVANRLAGRDLYRWDIISRDGQSIAASNGMSLVADRSIADASGYPLAVICAGFDPEQYYDRRLKNWLQRLNSENADLGAMDTGSFLLARAGLLDGYRASASARIRTCRTAPSCMSPRAD